MLNTSSKLKIGMVHILSEMVAKISMYIHPELAILNLSCQILFLTFFYTQKRNYLPMKLHP